VPCGGFAFGARLYVGIPRYIHCNPRGGEYIHYKLKPFHTSFKHVRKNKIKMSYDTHKLLSTIRGGKCEEDHFGSRGKSRKIICLGSWKDYKKSSRGLCALLGYSSSKRIQTKLFDFHRRLKHNNQFNGFKNHSLG
jgi:hypothetical protein